MRISLWLEGSNVPTVVETYEIIRYGKESGLGKEYVVIYIPTGTCFTCYNRELCKDDVFNGIVESINRKGYYALPKDYRWLRCK